MNDLSARLARLSPEQRQQVLDQMRARRTLDSEPALPRRAHGGGEFPLSFAQERMWFLDQMSPGNPFYNLSFAQRIPFAVDQAALERALTVLVGRHGALRTCYPVLQGSPVQRVLPATDVHCALVDLSASPVAAREADLEQLAAQIAQQPFDLASGPVFRAVLVRLGRFESAFIFVVHHIAADNASMEIVFRELGTLYGDAVAGRESSLKDVPVQYADFAVWQREWLSGQRLASQVSFWQQQLANLTTLSVPTDRTRPPVQRYRGAHLEVTISKDRRRSLERLAKQASATPFMLLLTAFAVLLHRYTQQDDVAVGVPIINRTRRELEGVVGFFANSLVMRADLSGNPTFLAALARVRETALQAYSHQDVPFSAVVAAVRPQQDLSRNPLFQVSFQLVSQSGAGPAGTQGASVAFEKGNAIFDLALNLWEQQDEIRGVWEYNTDLFDRETADRMVRHYLTLLDSVAEHPATPIGSLALLSEDERRQVLVEWNATNAPYPDCTLHALVEAQVQRTPGATAVRCGDTVLTYAEVDRRAWWLAQHIQRRQLRADSAIGVMLTLSPDLVVSLLAILKSGHGYVPLDPATPTPRLAAMLQSAAVELVIASPGLVERLSGDCQTLALTSSMWDQMADDVRPLSSPATSASVAYIIFTSGSTGVPKGVVVPHRAVVNYLEWCRRVYPVGPGDAAPLCSPPWSDMSVTTLFLPLACGGCVDLLEQDDVVEALDRALRSGVRFSFVKLTPSHLDALANLSLGRPAPTNASAFIVGGEALVGESLALWREQAPDLWIFNEYGPTETVVGCAVHGTRAGDLRPGPVPIGKPIANTRLYVLDRYGEPVPIGVTGELYIAGDGVTLGYANAPALTDEHFVSDPFSPAGGRMYRTGDQVRGRSDGTLEFLGRLDGQIKVRGYRIERGDVEAAIRRHPDVTDVVVTARDLGHGDRRLVAHVVLAPGTDRAAVARDLRTFAARELPTYMVPATFAVIDGVPLTSAGKADLRALEHVAPANTRAAARVPPASALERLVALAFEDVLTTPSISIDDDFFVDLGGHSLLATRVVARLRDLLRFELPLRTIFEAPSVRRLAAALAADPADGADRERVAATVLAVLEMPDEEVNRQLASPEAVSRTAEGESEPSCA